MQALFITILLGAKRDFEVWTYDSDNSTRIKCLIQVEVVLWATTLGVEIKCIHCLKYDSPTYLIFPLALSKDYWTAGIYIIVLT